MSRYISVPTEPPPGNVNVANNAEAAAASLGTVTTEPPPGNVNVNNHAAVAEDTIYDLEYFQNFDMGTTNTPYKKHSRASLWFRHCLEKCGGSEYVFRNDADIYYEVPSMIDNDGPEYIFVECECSPWCKWQWQEMVAQLDDDSMRTVVQGPDYRSRGLISCSYRRHMEYKGEYEFGTLLEMVWEFVLTRDDGSCVSLRPNHDNKNVKCKYWERETDHEVPMTGLGGTSGPGTFKRVASKGSSE